MGFHEDAASALAQAEAIKDLQAQLAAAQAANAALQAVIDADAEAVKAPAKSKGPFWTAFSDNVRDRMEATSPYQVCYWLQEAINSATDAYHDHTGYTAAELEECLADA
ncbi:hypothetical protein I4F81_007385 [Pyropia yezoensis]|uniref:Uncharacterized protein n=1 Tax=Pyropia yezoensis TaxID=2788 RepID=A0ACC3C423_PYRYE|nr:hypothetical protein I4F81_007385 [Neopyropia yezoensis]